MKIVAVVSGGLDSTTLLYHLKEAGHGLLAISFDYGQRHSCELEKAKEVCQLIKVPHRVADVSSIGPIIAGNSALLNDAVEVPDGHYESENMKVTVVPNRNMIMLSIAAGYAIANKCNALAYAAHKGDHAIYPDCREEFIAAMRQALWLCDWSCMELSAPFSGMSKTEIVKRGAELKVPFEKTWSCYRGGGKLHCGTCGTCTERKEAFRDAGVKDPTEYEK